MQLSPAVSRALDPLRFRPLLWMALCALLGLAVGNIWAPLIGASSRADERLLWPLFPAFIAAVTAYDFRRDGLKWRLSIAAMLIFGFAASAAQRMTPPVGDISELTRFSPRIDGPIKPVSVEVRGVVSDYPRNGDFSMQFPLQCTLPRAGNIWVSAPYGTPVKIGDEIRVNLELVALPQPGNPAERASFWRYIGASCWCLGRKPDGFEPLGVDGSFTIARRIGDWRDALLQHYETQFRGDNSDAALRMRPFPAATAQLLTAMVFGEGGLSRPLPQSLQNDFRAAGLSHVLVASGTQVAFLTVIVLWMARGLGVKRALLLLIVVPILIFYALLAGSAASIWRATLGGVLLTWALLLGRDVDGLSLWSAALLLLLLLDPLGAWSLSFQLTFAATWGLLVIAPALSRLFQTRFGGGKTFDLAALSLGAQAATWPISLFHFGSFSAAGLSANFIAVPVAGFMVGSGLLGLVFSPVNILNYYLTRGIAGVAHGFALLPGARLSSSPIAIVWSWACYALLLGAIAPLSFDWKPLLAGWSQKLSDGLNGVSKWRPWTIFALCLGVGVWILWLRYGPNDPNLRVTMLDVGQGESILIRTPSGHNILIDGGSLESRERSDIGAQVIVPALQSLGVERLDLVVLTHSDADHCNGLAAVAREIPVGEFLDGPSALSREVDPALTDYFELRKTLDARGVPILTPRAGQTFAFGQAKLTILAPSLPLLDSANENCIVSRLDFGASSVLLTGDVEAGGEARLLSRGADLHCTVLKTAHHGSKTSTTAAFLRAASPRVALISCGRYNRFGHPNAQTLHHLTAAKVAIFRTDISGALSVSCDSKTCNVTPFR